MLNQVELIGNLGNDPDIRQTQSGDKVANFSLATSESWKDKNTGEKKTKSEWHRVVVWGNIVSVIENYVKKGSKIYIRGSLKTRKWQDQNGKDNYMTEVVLQGFDAKLIMLDTKKDTQGQANYGQANQGQNYQNNQGQANNQGNYGQDNQEMLDDEIPY